MKAAGIVKPFKVVGSAARNFVMRFRGARTIWGGIRRGGFHYGKVGNGSNSSVVMAPLQWLLRTFPEAPCVVDRVHTNVWEVEPAHPMAALIRRPNDYYNGDLLWRATVSDTVLSGETYWLKVFDFQLRVVQLWWIPAMLMEPKSPQDGSTFISHYIYKPGGEPIRLDISQVVHFRWELDPDDNRHGMSPLTPVLREVFADDEAGKYAASLLANMGVPGLIVAPKGDYVVEPDDLAATEDYVNAKFTGEGRGKPWVFGAPTEVVQFGFTPQQMDMRTLRRVPEERVSGVLGIPAIVAGLGAGLDRSTFSNMAEAREMAYESCVIPLQKLMAADVTHQLLPEFESNMAVVRTRFDVSEVRVLQEDQNKIVERKLKELTNGAITLAEYRRETGREADDSLNVYLRPFNLTEIPVAQIGQPAPIIDVTPKNGNGNGKDYPDLNFLGFPEEDVDSIKMLKAAYELQHKLQARFRQNEVHMTAAFIPKLTVLFDTLGREAAEVFRQTQKNAKADDTPEDIEALAREVARLVSSLNVDKSQAKLKAMYEVQYGNTADLTVQAVNDVFGMSVSLPDHAMRQVLANGGRRAGLIDLEADAKNSIFRALSEGRANGESVAQLARRIRSEVPAGRYGKAGSSYRSKLIAKTETKYAQNVSAMSAYREAGATHLLAFDAQGGDTDDECIARDGQTFTLGEAETELEQEHPNGTLSFAPIFA